MFDIVTHIRQWSFLFSMIKLSDVYRTMLKKMQKPNFAACNKNQFFSAKPKLLLALH